MQKRVIKWSVGAVGAGIIASALITANLANAQNKSDVAGSIMALNPQAEAIAQNIFKQILKIFAYPSSYFNQYITKTTMPVNSQMELLNGKTKKQASYDTLSYLSKNSLYVDNSLDTQQNFAKQVPIGQHNAKKQASLFNSGTLLNNLTLNQQQQSDATNYILYLADAGNPIASPPEKANWVTNGSSAATQYLNQFGTYNAQLSAGLGIMFNLLEERKPQSELNGLSPLAHDAAAANRRMLPQWYQKITSDKFTAADIQREQLAILAEQRYESYQIRMQLENIASLLATMQMQQVQYIGKPIVTATEVRARQAGSAN